MNSVALAPGEGVLNVDKPVGMTSHDVVNRLRRLTGIRRIGHAGTLDPMATGVLLLCVGRATRLVEYLVGHRKRYDATVRLGQTTDTYDAEGTVQEERPFSHIPANQLQEALSQFRGPTQQRPPIYSAIKRQGKPLYKYAREGVAVDIPPRQVTIYELEMLDWQPPDIRLHIICSAGTYIRSLAHDLGELLGCGGHIRALRRTAVGDFDVRQAVPLADLTAVNWQEYMQASDTTVAHMPRLDLSEIETKRLKQGQRPPRRQELPLGSPCRAYDPDGRFIGIVAVHEEYLQAQKIFL